MLSKKFRIGNRGRIEWILKKGRRRRGRLFEIHYLPNRHPYSRFSVIAGSKVSKKAVERNRSRRRVYEVIRSMGFATKTCYDIVVICFHQIRNSSHFETKKDLLTLLAI